MALVVLPCDGCFTSWGDEQTWFPYFPSFKELPSLKKGFQLGGNSRAILDKDLVGPIAVGTPHRNCS